MSKTVLVTGGAGFIGSHLVEALTHRNYRVRVLDNLTSGKRENVSRDAEFIHGDIADAKTCLDAAKNVDGIFHLAAMSRVGTNPDIAEICTNANVVGTVNILTAAKTHQLSKVIYSGSSTFYGNQLPPHREFETPTELLNFYGLSKQVGEQYCRMFHTLFGTPSIILRYFNVYGPRQPQTGAYALVLGIFLRAWLKSEPLMIHGGGGQRRDFIHVSDVVRANIMAFESQVQHDTFNVGSGSNISIKELADMVSDQQQVTPARVGDSLATLADISHIRDVLGWTPLMSFADGLTDLKQRLQNGQEKLETL